MPTLPRETPPPANVRQFPLILPPDIVIALTQRQKERATKKAVARHERRKRRREL